jgi:circadian clock protein KaiB
MYVLVLYVTGSSPLSMRAVKNLRALCDQYLAGRHRIEIVDLYKHPELAASSNVIAAPTMVKSRPLPVQRFVGDFSDAATLIGRMKARR